jgi:hypothetical protein
VGSSRTNRPFFTWTLRVCMLSILSRVAPPENASSRRNRPVAGESLPMANGGSPARGPSRMSDSITPHRRQTAQAANTRWATQ